MDELEEIKKRKLMELQARQRDALQQQAEEQAQLSAQIEQLEALVKQFLTKDALQRYGTLKLAHAEKAIRVLTVLAQLIHAGKIRAQIDDNQFRQILKSLETAKPKFRITRK